ncbi:MAG: FAD:protein FMN transferase [Pirellulaceae bacterium]
MSDDSFQLARPGELISVAVRAMATDFEVLLPADAARHAPEVAIEALESVLSIERLFSVYQIHSDVSKLNREGYEHPVRVDRHVFDVVQSAIELSERTAGAFDITAGPLIDAWGFTERSGRKPDDAEIADALRCVGYQKLELNAERSEIRFREPKMRINLGAIGKGYALDHAARMLVVAGIDDFLIHGGQSSLLARGRRRRDEQGWPVALSHPIRGDRKLGRIWLRNQSLSTSGSGKQFFHYRGKRLGHVIDPRTGWPTGDFLSLTLITSHATQSDALATGMFVLGREHAIKSVQSSSGISMVAVASAERKNEVEVTAIGTDAETWQPFL